MRWHLVWAACLMLVPFGAIAEQACYARDYAESHLVKNPAQVVSSIRLWLPADLYRDGMRLSASFADRGHVQGSSNAGQTLRQGLFCLQEDGPLRCGVECDGGLLTVTRHDDDVLEFRTRYLMVGDTEECGGAVDLAEEPDKEVTYRLFATDLEVCSSLRVD